jgi:alpha-1,3-rhamnosyl/mannosyltransferase
MKLKIVFNATAVEHPLTGVGSYALNVLKRLLLHPQVEQVLCIKGARLVCPYQLVEKIESPSSANHPEKFDVLCKPWLKKIPYARVMVNAFRLKCLLEKLRTAKGAVFFEPNYIVQQRCLPFVPVIHDLSHFHFPGFHPKERVSWMQAHLASTLASSSAVITISEHSLNDIVDHFDVPREKIFLAPPGVDEAYFCSEKKETMNVLDKYKLQPGYLLTVGAIEPRKNLKGLLQAFQKLPTELCIKHPLVVVGPLGWYSSEIIDMVKKTGPNVIVTGYVPTEDLPALYSNAHGFAYPSFFEGFGMPLLEAMAAGVPVLTSNCSSMPEVTGTYAVHVDPADQDSIARGLMTLIEDESFRRSIVSPGIERARKFSWDDSVETILESLFIARKQQHL